LWYFLLHGHRLEESLTEREGTLLLERQESEAIKKLLTEARGENEELVHNIEVAERDIAKFQNNIERSIAGCPALAFAMLR
jgi:hypothetical protein